MKARNIRQETIITYMTIGLKVATGHYYKYICDFSQSEENRENQAKTTHLEPLRTLEGV